MPMYGLGEMPAASISAAGTTTNNTDEAPPARISFPTMVAHNFLLIDGGGTQRFGVFIDFPAKYMISAAN